MQNHDPAVQDHVKIGILMGSVVSGATGAVLLSISSRRTSKTEKSAAIKDLFATLHFLNSTCDCGRG
ncbi:hypothetical protein [Agrobacterium sp. T29]|uniref:hypothetical protein n=1 Tax=Agrobacterium sp. T29 TaxID=2580515 RepID=UPI00115E64D6|nr:hypothetical protein [Agrobacterium sp. T29]